MRYMLMMHAPLAGGAYEVNSWSPQDLQAHISFMHDLNKELTASGELVGAQGLAAPIEARVVTSGPSGAPVVTDGPFPEAKEFLAGFWIVEVETTQRAFEIAAQASSAPGPGGAPMHLKIEVRQVLGAPPVDA